MHSSTTEQIGITTLYLRRKGVKVLITRRTLNRLQNLSPDPDYGFECVDAIAGEAAHSHTAPVPEVAFYTYFLYIFGLGCYLFDVVTDITLAVTYYRSGDMLYFGLTVLFVVGPSLLVTAFSLAWYCIDYHPTQQRRSSRLAWGLRLAYHLLQLAPIVRLGQCIIKATGVRRLVKGLQGDVNLFLPVNHRCLELYGEMLLNEADCAMLRMFEAFTESAPQLLLQLSMMLGAGNSTSATFLTDWTVTETSLWRRQAVSSLVSLVSLSWAACAYQSALRSMMGGNSALTISSLMCMLTWKLFVLFSRVLAFALTASTRPKLLLICLACHYFVSLIWIRCQKTDFCNGKQLLELGYNMVVAGITCLDFFNVCEGRTRLKYTLYYLVVFAENAALLCAWYFLRDIPFEPYGYEYLVATGLFSAGMIAFPIGIFFMTAYYLWLHPSAGVPCCVPCAQLNLCGRARQQDQTGLANAFGAHA